MRFLGRPVWIVSCFLLLPLVGLGVEGEPLIDGGNGSEQHRKSLRRAYRDVAEEKGRFFALPIEIDTDGNAPDGGATVVRFLPVFALRLGPDWNLLNMSIITVADSPGGIPGEPGNPDPVPGPPVFGLSDFANTLVFSPTTEGAFNWGAGFMLGFPTATDERLGSGKWTAGPALRFIYEKENWSASGICANTWSYAGDEDRADTNQFMARLFFSYEFAEDWLLVSAPILTANWNAEPADRWRIPVGGGIARDLEFMEAPFRVSLQVYNNVIKPEGAPDWLYRVSVVVPIPK